MKSENTTINSFLSFTLGEEEFAAHVSKVLNILELVKITKVPRAPEYMKGVINLRGTVLPVIDTRLKFGLTETEVTTKTCIIVTEIEINKEIIHVGALVDSVQEVLEIEESDILAPPSIGNSYKSQFIYGMVRHDERFIMLLDMEKVFSTEDLNLLKESSNLSKAEALA